MQLRGTKRLVLLAMCTLFKPINSHPAESLPATLLGGIGNVASSATNFLSGVVQRQKELLHRVTDTAANYINHAVEQPRNLLINATKATTGIIDSAASKGLEFKLRRILEKFRSRMRYGIPELDLPPLEPLHIDEIRVIIDNDEIGNLTLFIEDLLVRKLSTFQLGGLKLSLSGPTVMINLSIPELGAEGYYNLSGMVGDLISLHGAGPFQATLYDLRISTSVMLGFANKIYVKEFDLDFTIGSTRLNLENLMNDEQLGDIVNKVFQELTPEALYIIKPDILPVLKTYIGERVNDTLKHLTVTDVVNVLLGPKGIRNLNDVVMP